MLFVLGEGGVYSRWRTNCVLMLLSVHSMFLVRCLHISPGPIIYSVNEKVFVFTTYMFNFFLELFSTTSTSTRDIQRDPQMNNYNAYSGTCKYMYKNECISELALFLKNYNIKSLTKGGYSCYIGDYSILSGFLL